MAIREDAIALLVEKLRELEGIENALYANHARKTKNIGGMSYQTYQDHLDGAALHYAAAYRYEQLIEEITARSLFDELDAQDAAADQAAKDAEAQDDAMSASERFEHDQADEAAQDARDDARNAADAAESEAGQ